MTLRAEIHSAFDQIAPPTRGMPERVVSTALAELPRRRRAVRWSVRLRGPMSLVAVFLLVAIVVAALIGGRVMQDWATFINKPVPASGIDQAQLALLESRPLRPMPAVKSGAPCPDGPITNAGYYGSGPVYGLPGQAVVTKWGTYWSAVMVADGKLKGLIVVRARDLQTGQEAIYVGQYGTGPVSGTDILDGKTVERHLELVFDLSHASADTIVNNGTTWEYTLGLAKGHSGCIGWQIDGTTFTETYVEGLIL